MTNPLHGGPVNADVADAGPPPRSDKSLLRRYRAGDSDAATALYRRYARRLRGLVAKHCGRGFGGRFDPDDVTQSTFRVFFDGVRKETYDAPPGGEIWGLLVTLALSKVRGLVERHTAAKRDVRADGGGPAELLGRDEAAASFLRLVIDEQVDALPEAHRPVVRLRMEGFEVDEIAVRTGRSPRTVERVLHQFRSRLAAVCGGPC
jgi:RNA polymerase sigma-70 factor, ECF subfamily